MLDETKKGDYEIKYFNDNCCDDMEMGRCDDKRLILHVCKNMPGQNLKNTLLHEAIHAISGILHLELEERQVCGLTSGISGILKQLENLDE